MVIDPKNAAQNDTERLFFYVLLIMNVQKCVYHTTGNVKKWFSTISSQYLHRFSTWKNVFFTEMFPAGSREPSPRPRTRYREGAPNFPIGERGDMRSFSLQVKDRPVFFNVLCFGVSGCVMISFAVFVHCRWMLQVVHGVAMSIFMDGVFGVGVEFL